MRWIPLKNMSGSLRSTLTPRKDSDTSERSDRGRDALREAMVELATGSRPLWERFAAAFARHMSSLREGDLPADAWQRLAGVRRRLADYASGATRPSPDGGAKPVEVTGLTDDDAAGLIRDVFAAEDAASVAVWQANAAAHAPNGRAAVAPRRRAVALAPPKITPDMERAVGVSLDDLSALYLLESVRGFGPQKFKELHELKVTAREVIADPDRLPTAGARGASFRAQLSGALRNGDSHWRGLAARQIAAAHRHDSRILTHRDGRYPELLYKSNNPVPVLYVRGNSEVLLRPRAVTSVGSRGIRSPYRDLHAEFARTACAQGFTVVSGFALGADTVGHEAAWKANGRTIAVMPGGLDRPFPPENRDLWSALLEYQGAALVSEFPFGTPASALTLRRRNKTIVSLALGVLVGQSAADGGTMNAYRFAVEQKKPVASFESDGTPETSGNRIVGDSAKAQGTLFPADHPDRAAFGRWLRVLSSST